MNSIYQVLQVTPKAVKLPNDEGVAGPGGFKALIQPRTLFGFARNAILVDVPWRRAPLARCSRPGE
jgi:hypothetical protein